jgi:hypothetical protein
MATMVLSAPKTYKDPQTKAALSILSRDRSQMQLKLHYGYWTWKIVQVTGIISGAVGFGLFTMGRFNASLHQSQQIISCAHYETGDPPSCRLVLQPAMQRTQVLPLQRQPPAQVVKTGTNQAYLQLKGDRGQTYRYGDAPLLTIAQAEDQAQRINQFTNPRITGQDFQLQQQQQPSPAINPWEILGALLPLLGGLALAQYIGFEETWLFDRTISKFSIQPQGFFPGKKLEFANGVVTQVQLATEYPTTDQPNAQTKYNVHILTIDGVWLRQGNTTGRIIYGFTQLDEAEQFAQVLRYHLGLVADPEVPR